MREYKINELKNADGLQIGWRLQLLEDGEDMGGGVYPWDEGLLEYLTVNPDQNGLAADDAYDHAQTEGATFIRAGW